MGWLRRVRAVGWVLAAAVVMGLPPVHRGVSSGAGIAWACPMCREALPDSQAGSAAPDDAVIGSVSTKHRPSMAKGYYYSILLMLGVLFATALGMVGTLCYHINRSPVVQPSASPTPPFDAT